MRALIDRYGWLLVSSVAIAAVSVGWFALYALGLIGAGAAVYLCIFPAAVIMTVSMHRLTKLPGLHPGSRRFWRHMSLLAALECSLFVIMGADALLNGNSKTVQVAPPTAALVPIVGIVAVFVWALFRLPINESTAADRVRLLLDGSIVTLGSGAFLWHFAVGPVLTGPTRVSGLVVLGIGVACLTATAAVVKVMLAGSGPVERTSIHLFGLATAVGGAVSTAAATLGEAGVVGSNLVGATLVSAIITMAAYRQRLATSAAGATGTVARERRPYSLLPYGAVVAVDGLLLLVTTGTTTWPDRLIVLIAIIITLLIVVRQMIALRANARLLTEVRAQKLKAQYDATHDALTGLANRALFAQRLAEALERPEPVPVAVVLIDLDDFKAVNDTLGHATGDALLRGFADLLRGVARESDLAVRLGGDEFALLLHDLAGDGGASGTVVADRILQQLTEPIDAGSHRLMVRASLGSAPAGPGDTAESLLRNADLAMYAAKARGKGTVIQYQPGLERRVLTDMQLGGELQEAIAQQQFQLEFQPVVDLYDGHIDGVEALLRWAHPTRGMVPPVEFIPAAERTGLIIPIGRWVLRETCRQLAAWRFELGERAPRLAAVNVAAGQLMDPTFPDYVAQVLAETGLNPADLMLELTESSSMSGAQTAAALGRLHAIGVSLALDDFGTGESSLSLLRTLPINAVKLDKSFVNDMLSDDHSRISVTGVAIARAITQLAGSLGLTCIAEGIEHPQQVDRLRQLGYTKGQGFYLNRPVPAAELSRLLTTPVAAQLTPNA